MTDPDNLPPSPARAAGDEPEHDQRDNAGIAPHHDVEQVPETDDFQRTDDPSTPENVRPATTDGVGQAGHGGVE